MKILTVTAFALMASTTLPAQQTTSDWRMIGGTSDTYVFYDASRVRNLPDGHFEVWLKALPTKATNKAADKQLDKEHVDWAAKKITSGYVPPIGLDQKMTQDQIISAVGFEGIANDASVEPTS